MVGSVVCRGGWWVGVSLANCGVVLGMLVVVLVGFLEGQCVLHLANFLIAINGYGNAVITNDAAKGIGEQYFRRDVSTLTKWHIRVFSNRK